MARESATYTNDGVNHFPNEPAGLSKLSLFLGFALIGIAIAVFAAVLLQKSGLLALTNHGNQLLLGSTATTSGTYPLKLRLPAELDGKNRDDILEMRKREVARHDRLIAEGYKPNADTFKGLTDQSSWLGTLGKFGYADQQKATEGPADAARWLLNPLLLVGADIWPVNPSLERTKIAPSVFGTRRIEHYLEGQSTLPFVCEPVGLIWEPANSRAMVTYNVGAFLAERRKSDKKQVVLGTMADVDFNMFNARDLDFRYCYTSPKFAKNIKVEQTNSGMPFEISDAIQDVGNGNLAAVARQPEGKFLLTGEFPATIEFLLWKKKPSADTEPDVRYTVRFDSLSDISPTARQWVEYFRGSQDALCIAGVALADIAANPQQNLAARDRAMLASQRLESLEAMQHRLPELDGRTEKEVKRFVTGKELSIGYSIFSRSANVMQRLRELPEYEQLLVEYGKPHWRALHGLGQQARTAR